jgi:hypothetical protein
MAAQFTDERAKLDGLGPRSEHAKQAEHEGEL